MWAPAPMWWWEWHQHHPATTRSTGRADCASLIGHRGCRRPGHDYHAPTGLAAHAPNWMRHRSGNTVAPALLGDLLAFALGFSAFAQRFARRDALHGLPLRLSDGNEGTGCGGG